MSTVDRARAWLGPLGFGASTLGNLYREMSDDQARAVVDRAWEGGIRYFDVAPHYGLGLAERRLGDALRSHPRDAFVVSTKVGRVLEPNPDGAGRPDPEGFAVNALFRRRWDFSAEGVRQSLEDSLERLGLDRVDIVYLHDPEERLALAVDEALPALVELREAGVVGAIGVGSKDVSALTALIGTGSLDLAMVAGRYTLLEQPALAEVFPAAHEHDTAIVAVGVYNSGLLARPVPEPTATYEYEAAPAAMFERAVELADVCNAHGVTLPHAAVQFALRHPLVANVTIGIGSASHLDDGLAYASSPVPESLWRELESRGLIGSGVEA
jgi:D-threo-aldose 1-dehydrogenase